MVVKHCFMALQKYVYASHKANYELTLMRLLLSKNKGKQISMTANKDLFISFAHHFAFVSFSSFSHPAMCLSSWYEKQKMCCSIDLSSLQALLLCDINI
jgi:hypothetical protein